MNEDVCPIENGDFPVSHVSFFRGVSLGIWILVCNHQFACCRSKLSKKTLKEPADPA